MLIRTLGTVLVCLCAALPVAGQPSADIQRVMDRLDRLEKQNQELLTEIQELRQQLKPGQNAAPPAEAAVSSTASAQPTPAERLDVQESRTEELAQTKVGTTQRFPVWLTGTVLFNAFHNSGLGGASEFPLTAQLTDSPASTGATFRQTIIGLRFNGPDLPGSGKSSGSAIFDLWGGTAAAGNNLFRIRTATIDLTWHNTTITAGQDKPIVSPREPVSLAQVGLAPLAGAGNLWDWQPQVRIEQRFGSSANGFRAQAGIYETAEAYPSTNPVAFAGTLERQRPAYEGRLLYYHGSETRRLEIAPGFHASDSHVAGQTVNSRLGTLDWLVRPSNLIEFTGALFRGTDDAGLGGLRQGFTILPTGQVIPVHGTGAWSQLAIFATSRVSLHIFGGQEEDRASDLVTNSVRRNLTYAGNVVYKLAPNVLAAFEVAQTRTDYISAGLRRNNHYDLALAYLF
jgi:hypothetical protein